MAASIPVAVRDRANQPGFLFAVNRWSLVVGFRPWGSRDSVWLEEDIGFFFSGREAFGQGTAVVFRHAIFPFEEVGDALRFDANLDAAQAGEQVIHFVTEARGRAEVLGRRPRGFDSIVAEFEEAPARGKFFAAY